MLLRMPLVAALGLTLALPPAEAAETSFRLDPGATEIGFTLGATLHTVDGTFRMEEGIVRFDRETGALGGRIVVDARSGETGNRRRDRKMHAQVLDSTDYPSIVFVPEKLTGEVPVSGHATVTVHGTLTLLGAGHPLDLRVEIDVHDRLVEATTRFRVPYVAWGLKDPSVFVLRVDKYVDVTVRGQGRLEG
ncbi:MAG TPA: YceI family protein [Candidatus Polarisedimenticolia bacterium]|nr:YceI family protein [Candidatus Polarisedimenticolia bacterium]